MSVTKIRFQDVPPDYAGLVALYAPRPLHDADDELDVEEIIEAMAGHELTADQTDYLDLLSDLLLKYQEDTQPKGLSKRSPMERLKYLMEESGMSSRELAKVLGCSQPLVSLILGGKRKLTVGHVRKLAERFGVEGGYFL